MGFFGFIKCSLRLGIEAFILMLVITFIPGLPPDVNFTEVYKITKASPEGKFAYNNKLDEVEILFKDEMHGPECFADDSEAIYTSVHKGDIYKIVGKHSIPIAKFGKPCKGVHEEEICGRPLGLRFGKDGYLYVADAYYGIFKLDVKSGEKTKLVPYGEEIEGRKSKLPNSVAIACNGDIFWTDSSTDFKLHDGLFSLLSDPTGRLIHYDAKTGKNKVLLDNIHFANGVVLSKSEEFVLIVECMRNRILRFYLKGPKQGTSDVFLDGLPGIPDNIQTDGGSGFLISIVSEANSKHPNLIQVFSQFPNVRKFLARSMALVQLTFKTIDRIYPNEFSQKGVHFVGHIEPVGKGLAGRTSVVHVSENGDVLDILWSSNKTIRAFSEAYVVKDHLYLGSPFNKYVGRIPLSKIGWEHLKQKSDSLTSIKQKCLGKYKESETITGATQKPTTTTPKPTTTTPKPTTTTPKPAAATQKPTTTTPKPTAATQKPTTTTPKPRAAPTKVEDKPTTPTPKPREAVPKTEGTKKSPPPTEKPKTEKILQDKEKAKLKENKVKPSKNEL